MLKILVIRDDRSQTINHHPIHSSHFNSFIFSITKMKNLEHFSYNFKNQLKVFSYWALSSLTMRITTFLLLLFAKQIQQLWEIELHKCSVFSILYGEIKVFVNIFSNRIVQGKEVSCLSREHQFKVNISSLNQFFLVNIYSNLMISNKHLVNGNYCKTSVQ